MAAGNSNSMVGCTFTTTLSEQQKEFIKQREERANKKVSTQETLSVPARPEGDGAHPLIIPYAQSVSATNELNNSIPNTSATSTSTSATTQTTTNTNLNLNRTNFNLRGHKSDIKLVRWNEVNWFAYQLWVWHFSFINISLLENLLTCINF